MKYWVCVTTQDNWEIIKSKNVWGVTERAKNILSRVAVGDRLIFYVIQTRKDGEVIPSRLVGIFEVASKPYYDDKPVFKTYKGNIFPHRIKIKPVKIFSKPIIFKDLVDKLSFIKNKRFWTVYFRRAMFEIPANDYNVIEKMGK